MTCCGGLRLKKSGLLRPEPPTTLFPGRDENAEPEDTEPDDAEPDGTKLDTTELDDGEPDDGEPDDGVGPSRVVEAIAEFK